MANKKVTPKKSTAQAIKPAKSITNTENLSATGWIEAALLLLYLVVHFISDLGSVDTMGPQWLFLSAVNGLTLLYLISTAKSNPGHLRQLIKNPFTIVFSLYFIWAGASYFYSINPNEMVVCFSRLATTFMAFICISLLLLRNKNIFGILASAFVFILFYESVLVLNHIADGISSGSLDDVILKTTGNAGNKNIIAASIAIKIPFCIYLISRPSILSKVTSSVVLFVALIALTILSTRSTFVSLGLIAIVFLIYTIFLQKEISLKDRLKPYAYFIGALAVAVMVSFLVFNTSQEITDKPGGTYDNPISRISKISLSNEGSGGRLGLWTAAYDHFLQHPILGCGFGNWKIASIPYESSRANDFFVPYHAHNDFLENAAELGVIGLLLYVGLFLVFLWTILRAVFSSVSSSNDKLVLVTASMSMLAYMVDAFLNFPAERPIIQVNFAFFASFIFLASNVLFQKIGEQNENKINNKTNVQVNDNVFVMISMALVILFSVFINSEVYDSMKGQRLALPDMDKNVDQLPDFNYEFPTYPNLSYNTIPIDAIRARYLFKKGENEKGFELLDRSIKYNPGLYFNENLKGAIYLKMNNLDSGLKYTRLALKNKPRVFSAYKNSIYGCIQQKDSVELEKTFTEFIKYRNESNAWREYLIGLFNIRGRADADILRKIDTAIAKFPDSASFYVRFKNDIQPRTQVIQKKLNPNDIVVSSEVLDKVRLALQNATTYFGAKKFDLAAKEYLIAASLDKVNYIHLENAAISFYSMAQYDKAIGYFDQAIARSGNTAGKSFYYRGVSQIYLGKKDIGCNSIKQAIKNGFQGDANFNATNCK